MTPSWRDDALCREVDANDHVWFPTRGESTGPAKRICRLCPVQASCLSDALEIPQDRDYGIRAGTTPGKRRKLRREAARPLAPVIDLPVPSVPERRAA